MLRLRRAMQQFPQADFSVHWRPFQLNPQAPLEGVNKLDFYKTKFGEARTKQMLPYMTVSG